MEANRSLIEELRHRLSRLESSQRATGSTADPGFLARTFAGGAATRPDAAQPGPGAGPDVAGPASDTTPSRDAAEPALRATTGPDIAGPATGGSAGPDAAEPGPSASPGPDAAESGDERDGSEERTSSTGLTGFTAAGGLAAKVAAATRTGFGPGGPEPVQVPEGDLIEVVGELGALTCAKERLLVSVVTELESRSVDSPGGLSRTDWLRTQDPTLSAGQAKAIVTVAKAFAEPRWQGLKDAVIGEDGEDSGHGDDASGDGGTSSAWTTVGNAAQVVEFHDRLRKVADPDELDQAVDHLTDQAKRLRGEELAKLVRLLGDQVRPPKDTDDQDRLCRNSRGLWWGQPNATGMVHLRGLFDPEGAAILKSAIDPLAAPRPLTGDCGDAIETDERSPEQRRADALIELVQRAVSAPDGAPSTDKAKIVVTFDYDTLAQNLSDAVNAWNARTTSSARAGFAGSRNAGDSTKHTTASDPSFSESGSAGEAGDGTERTTASHPGFAGSRSAGKAGDGTGGPGTGTGWDAHARDQRPSGSGMCMSGDVLSPQTVRRLACDAAIIPVVLGSHGQPLDVGREERLVTRAMRTALWLRDQGCTFPGCTIPAQWTEAHHVTHWLHGGTTALTNLALLCQRHHTHVHDQNLTATITGDGPGTAVTWHTWQHWKTGKPPPGRSPDQPAGPARSHPCSTARSGAPGGAA